MPAASSGVMEGTSIAVGAAVDHHHRHALAPQLGEQRVVDQRGGHDQPLDLARAQQLDLGVLALGVVVGVDDQAAVAGRLEDVLDAAHDRREERVGQVGDDQADGAGLRGLQPAGDRVGPVAQALGHLDHPPGGVGVDQSTRRGVEGARRGRRVDPGGVRDVPERGGLHSRHPRVPAARRAGASAAAPPTRRSRAGRRGRRRPRRRPRTARRRRGRPRRSRRARCRRTATPAKKRDHHGPRPRQHLGGPGLERGVHGGPGDAEQHGDRRPPPRAAGRWRAARWPGPRTPRPSRISRAGCQAQREPARPRWSRAAPRGRRRR